MRSLRSDEKIEELLLCLKDIRWDILLISETWRPEKEEFWSFKEGHVFIGSGGQNRSQGVAIIVHERWADNIKSTKAHNSRILTALLEIDEKKI